MSIFFFLGIKSITISCPVSTYGMSVCHTVREGKFVPIPGSFDLTEMTILLLFSSILFVSGILSLAGLPLVLHFSKFIGINIDDVFESSFTLLHLYRHPSPSRIFIRLAVQRFFETANHVGDIRRSWTDCVAY